jgi:hypothetical protein
MARKHEAKLLAKRRIRPKAGQMAIAADVSEGNVAFLAEVEQSSRVAAWARRLACVWHALCVMSSVLFIRVFHVAAKLS